MSDRADPTPPPPPLVVPPVPATPVAAEPWAAPSAPPFGAPPGYAPQVSYAPPPGYTGPYVAAAGPLAVPGRPAPGARGSALGVVALVAALGAAFLAPLVVGIAAFSIGVGAGRGIALTSMSFDFDWTVLTAVRGWVLAGEISFWVGTALGLWALVQGIVAIAADRGRGFGIAAVVISALGVVIFFTVLQVFLTAGLAAGSGIGG